MLVRCAVTCLLTGSVRGPSFWSEARRLIPRSLGEAINATSFFRPSSGLGYLPRDIIISWLCSDNQHGRVEIARLSRNAAKSHLDFGSCLDCAFQKARRVVIGFNLNSGSSQRKDAAFTNGAWAILAA